MLSPILLIIVTTISLTQGQQNETIVRRNHPVSSPFFDEIIVDGAFDVNLSQPYGISLPSVELETTVDNHKNVIVEILDNHILSMNLKRSIVVHKNINVYIRLNSPLRRYTIKGTGNTITDDNGLTNTGDEKFVLDNRGTANVALQLNVNKLEVYLSGTGNSRFWGEAREEALFETRGVGDVNAMNLLTERVKVHSAGVSTVRVAATKDVRIEVTGVSTVYYRLPGGKNATQKTSTGLGQIIRVP